jgi:cation diffusion facilitator CzcD-associated flavoprotein CzcO
VPGGGPATDAVDVLVIGAGITGIYQLYRALEAGFTARLLEAGDGVGGTWFWNRYPGARFDSESYTYGYLFSEELFNDWEWSEHFAEQPEIERYLNHVVDRFDLLRHIVCGARVTSATYREATAQWEVVTAGGSNYRARYVVAATGVLSVPYIPEVPGRDRFEGEQYHTGRWPQEPVDFTTKRVAVIGTGSSGVQIVPVIAADAATLTVFQRTPNWCTPLNNAPITIDEQRWLRDDFASIRETLNTSPAGFLHQPHDRATFDDAPEQRREYYETMWQSPGFSKLISHYTDLLFDDAANAAWCEFVAEKIRSIVHDPETAEKLIPKDHRFGEKRPPFVTDYFEAFNRPSVTLVNLTEQPIVGMTARGIETGGGVLEVDVVVWATGFDFGTGALFQMDIHGRGGLALREHWEDGPTTFLGLQTAGFPNFFFPGGPHAAAGNNPRYNGDQVDFVTETMVHARKNGFDTVEAGPDAEAAWTSMVDRWANRPPSFGQRSYYFGTNIPGKPRRYLLNSAGRPKFLALVSEVRQADFAQFEMSSSETVPGD